MANHSTDTITYMLDMLKAFVGYLFSFGTLFYGVVTNDKFLKFWGFILTTVMIVYYIYSTVKLKTKK